MVRQRSILSLILVLLTTFLISCGSPDIATPPPTYTPAQLEKIQEYLPPLIAVRDRSEELQELIRNNEWVKVGNFIHGPMAEARLAMKYITSNLLADDQPNARKVTRQLFNDLVKIDQGASNANSMLAARNYQAAYADIERFLQLLPDTTPESQES
ncbi:photosystem II protein PsbQ [Calothrix rhizosoleniae]|uniref:photosystem II protein PsbQ n=1 Tax=Calothrix rhizosoleniae TaxID=888997 RepID=UPI000B4A1AAF|nr:photosystem II protein PsbQ [Calothrix rhizosoleniae]